MPTWSSEQYLRFGDERTRPCQDLAARIALDSPRRIVDLGCGPGNSTDVLVRRWPSAEVSGVDNSAAMIEAARRSAPGRAWIAEDIAAWAGQGSDRFDLVFSNAALHWVGDHASLYPRLFARVAEGGVLAVQIPGNHGAAAHRLMRELAASARWKGRFPKDGVGEWFAHDLPFYYDVLAPLAARLDLWATEYIHVMAGPEGIVEWYKGSGLRPYLDALGSDAQRNDFLEEYLEKIAAAFPRRPDGRVLFPFRRIFVVAYRGGAA